MRVWLVPLVSLALVLCPIARAVVNTVTIFSPSNNRNLSFQIYLPPDYSAAASRYPAVYSLHGISGTAQGRANQVVPTLDAAIRAGTAPPMIYVFPDGQNNSFYGNAFDGHKQVYSNVVGEVLPYVDGHYRTIADRGHRAIEGFSMGGFGAAMYAAKHPELFSAIVEYGGALSRWQDLVSFNPTVAQEMYGNVEGNFLPYSLWDLSAQNAPALASQVDYMMLVGDADPQLQSNTRFRTYLSSLGVNPQFQILPGIAHDGRAYYAQGAGLQFLADHFRNAGGGSGLDQQHRPDLDLFLPEPSGTVVFAAVGWVIRRRR